MIGRRITWTAGLVVFFLCAGTTAGYAMWSSNATTSARAESGVIAVTQSGATDLAVGYSASTLTRTALVTVTNSGTITAPHSLRLSAPASSLASAVGVRTWPLTSATQCTAGATVPTTATSSNLTNVPALSSTLTPSAVAHYCIRTSITSAQQSSLASASATISSVVSSTVGSWASNPAAQTAVQSVTDTIAPSAPAPTARSLRTSTTLIWAAATDNVAVTSYEIFRNGVSVGTVTGTTFTESGLTAATTYSYTVVAKDAAGNSTSSAALAVKTVAIKDNGRYEVRSVAFTWRCLDIDGGSPAQGTALVDLDCGSPQRTNSQRWIFAPSSSDFFTVASAENSRVWSLNSAATYAQLFNGKSETSQQWQLVSVSPDTYQIINRSTGTCLTFKGGSPLEYMTMDVCSTTDDEQYFTVAEQ